MRLGDLDALLERADEITFMGFQADERKKHFLDLISTMLQHCPTIDAVPVKQSFWESYETSAYGGYDEDGVRWLKRRFFRCERCRKGSAIKSNFCPNCGADMGERKEDEGDG